MFKCYDCENTKYKDINDLYEHIEDEHRDCIPIGFSVQQYYYYRVTGREHGNCVMCKKPTEWNPNNNKYQRFCNRPICKKKYAEQFKKRMIGKYGKPHLLNDPDKQREMLANRKISGTYTWSDGKKKTYTGKNELDLLQQLDLVFGFKSDEVMVPSPHNYIYKYEGKDRFYFPDVFLVPFDLEIEAKDGGDNPNMHPKIQAVDKVKEKLKDEVLLSQNMFNYIKICNKDITNLLKIISELKIQDLKNEKKRIFILEDGDIKTKSVTESNIEIDSDISKIISDSLIEGVNSENVEDVLKEANMITITKTDLDRVNNKCFDLVFNEYLKENSFKKNIDIDNGTISFILSYTNKRIEELSQDIQTVCRIDIIFGTDIEHTFRLTKLENKFHNREVLISTGNLLHDEKLSYTSYKLFTSEVGSGTCKLLRNLFDNITYFNEVDIVASYFFKLLSEHKIPAWNIFLRDLIYEFPFYFEGDNNIVNDIEFDLVSSGDYNDIGNALSHIVMKPNETKEIIKENQLYYPVSIYEANSMKVNKIYAFKCYESLDVLLQENRIEGYIEIEENDIGKPYIINEVRKVVK